MNHLIRGWSIFLLLLTVNFIAWSQSTFDFSDCEVVFRNNESSSRTLSIELKGFVFDEELEYNDTYASITDGDIGGNETWGYDAPFSKDGSAGDSVDVFKDTLGCGRYELNFENDFYVINFIDGKFGAGPQSSVYRILFELYDDKVEVYVQEDGETNIYQSDDLVEYVGDYNEGFDNFYRIMINETGEWTYARELTTSNGETFHIDGGNVPRYGITEAILDVNPDITDDITVPSTCTLQIEVDDELTSGRITRLSFDAGKAMTVNGSFLTNNRYSSAITECTSLAGTPSAGDWDGIYLYTAASYKPITLNSLRVYYAVKGMHFYDCVTPTTNNCTVSYSASDAFTVSSGDEGSHTRLTLNNNNLNNIRVDDYSDLIYFDSCSIVGYSPVGGTGGNGVVVEEGSFAYFEDCSIINHEYHGIIVLTSAGVYVTGCQIYNNGEAADPKEWDGIHCFRDYYWATVRYSDISENDCGIRLNYGNAAGYWNPLSPDAQSPDSIGHNCIHDNRYNIYADAGQFEMAREYEESGTVHYMGWINSIYDASVLQGYFANSTNAFFQRDWWDGDMTFTVDKSKLVTDPKMFSDSTGCTEERGSSGGGSIIAQLSATSKTLYRQWSNLLSQPAQLRQTVLTALPNLTVTQAAFAFNLVLRSCTPADAESFFKSVTAMKLNNGILWRAWSSLGLAQLVQKKQADALQAYSNSINYTTRASESDYTSSHTAAAYVQHYLGNTAAALSRLDSLLTAFPKDREMQMAWLLIAGTQCTHTKISAYRENLNYSLADAYPNPFNPSTSIRFTVPEKQTVQIIVANALGTRVAVLADGLYDAGSHTVTFDASDLPSGVYLYTLKAGAFTQTKKMMLTK